MATQRVAQRSDALHYRYGCEQCGPFEPRVTHPATLAALRRHVVAHPDHDVWMSHVVMTHFAALTTGATGPHHTQGAHPACRRPSRSETSTAH